MQVESRVATVSRTDQCRPRAAVDSRLGGDIDPGRDGVSIQAESRTVGHRNVLAAAVERNGLAETARGKGRAAHQRAVVAVAAGVVGVAVKSVMGNVVAGAGRLQRAAQNVCRTTVRVRAGEDLSAGAGDGQPQRSTTVLEYAAERCRRRGRQRESHGAARAAGHRAAPARDVREPGDRLARAIEVQRGPGRDRHHRGCGQFADLVEVKIADLGGVQRAAGDIDFVQCAVQIPPVPIAGRVGFLRTEGKRLARFHEQRRTAQASAGHGRPVEIDRIAGRTDRVGDHVPARQGAGQHVVGGSRKPTAARADVAVELVGPAGGLHVLQVEGPVAAVSRTDQSRSRDAVDGRLTGDVDPGRDGVGIQAEPRTVGHRHVLATAVERNGLAEATRGKGRTAHQRAVVAVAARIVGIPVEGVVGNVTASTGAARLQRAAENGRRTAVGVRAAQRLRAAASLHQGKRAVAVVLHDPGKRSAAARYADGFGHGAPTALEGPRAGEGVDANVSFHAIERGPGGDVQRGVVVGPLGVITATSRERTRHDVDQRPGGKAHVHVAARAAEDQPMAAVDLKRATAGKGGRLLRNVSCRGVVIEESPAGDGDAAGRQAVVLYE